MRHDRRPIIWHQSSSRLKTLFLSLLLPLFILSSSAFAANLQNESYPATVRDISDRKYEHAVIELPDNAKESIVMSILGI